MSDIPIVQTPNQAIAYWLNVVSHLAVAIGPVLVGDGIITATSWQTYGGATVTILGVVVAVLSAVKTAKTVKLLRVERDRLRVRMSHH